MKTSLILLFVCFVISINQIYAISSNNKGSDSIDVNSDMIFDFVIERRLQSTMNIGASQTTIISIRPLNLNRLLYKPYIGYLFLGRGDTIEKTDTNKCLWTSYRADLFSIDSSNDNKGTIGRCDELCYLAIKLYIDNKIYIGWLGLNINTINGDIKIIETKLNDVDYILIR